MPRAVRVYLPATMDELAALTDTGSFAPRALGHAVTPAVQADDPDADTDDREFHAFCDAAASSLGLLLGLLSRPAALVAGGGSARRVVISADVDASRVQAQPGDGVEAGLEAGVQASGQAPSTVRIVGDIPAAAVAAVHVDGVDAEPAVRAVVTGAPASTLDDVALEWYAPSEVADLLG